MCELLGVDRTRKDYSQYETGVTSPPEVPFTSICCMCVKTVSLGLSYQYCQSCQSYQFYQLSSFKWNKNHPITIKYVHIYHFKWKRLQSGYITSFKTGNKYEKRYIRPKIRRIRHFRPKKSSLKPSDLEPQIHDSCSHMVQPNFKTGLYPCDCRK